MRPNGGNGDRRGRGRHHGGGGGGHRGGGGHGGPPRIGGGGGGNVGVDNRPRSASALRHQTFDSNCHDLRVRGNAWQVHEKYQALARDAQAAGDRVAAENYLQHAEHYYRIIEAINEATAAEQRQRGFVPGAPGFGGQPDMPTNYYGGEGPPPVTVAGAPNGNGQQTGEAVVTTPQTQGQAQAQGEAAPNVQAEAQVQQVRPPVPPASAFLMPDEDDAFAATGEPRAVGRR